MQGPPERNASADAANFDSALNVMFLAAFPLLLWVFQASFIGVATAVLQIWLFSVALRLISRGQRAQRAYDAADVAKRPRWPLKLIGSGLIGLMVIIMSGHQFDSLLLPLGLGFCATLLSVAAFGPDPLSDKGLDNPEVLARMAHDAALESTEHQLSVIADQVAALDDAELIRRTEVAREMILRLLIDTAQSTSDFEIVRKPVDTFVSMMTDEVSRLLTSMDSADYEFARRRYMAKLQVMTESFRKHARKKGFQAGRDAYEREADNLLHRMPRETAA